jgi:hypothetical protein
MSTQLDVQPSCEPDRDRLYNLLPAVYRLHDADRGHPLQALLRVIAEQVEVVQQDIARLYDNWFIETCEEWVVPYIGDLVGYVPIDDRMLTSRSEVANTIRFRRRKGTMALLEDLASTVSGWPSRAVELYRHLGVMQNVNSLHVDRGHTVSLRNGAALAQMGDAFDVIARNVDVRRASSHRAAWRYGIPNAGFFLWRLRSYAVTQTQASSIDRRFASYTFSSLGNDVALFTRVGAGAGARRIAGTADVPAPIRHRDFEMREAGGRRANPAYYGRGKGLQIWTGTPPAPVSIDRIVPADLTHWRYRPKEKEQVLVDPERGRMVFHEEPEGDVLVTYHYGFSTEMGGGEYERTLVNPTQAFVVLKVQTAFNGAPAPTGTFSTLAAALDAARGKDHVVIEILDSCLYQERIVIEVGEGHSLQLRAASGARPVILIPDQRSRPDTFLVKLESGARFTMDGLVVAGRAVQVRGPEADPKKDAGMLLIRHCTLVPGWLLDEECEPCCGDEPSLEVNNSDICIRVERSILGSIFIRMDERRFDPVRIHIADSIIDATSTRLRGDVDEGACRTFHAISHDACGIAHAVVTIVRSTIIGDVRVHAITLAENSIFLGSVVVARRQIGCIRFCYVGPESRTPRRFECQPDLVEQVVRDLHAAGKLTDAERDQRLDAERLRVVPEFNSTRYGMPTYCQLADTCADEITRGADDQSEMGAFHDLYQAQRVANLRARLDEYTPAGMDAGIIFAS